MIETLVLLQSFGIFSTLHLSLSIAVVVTHAYVDIVIRNSKLSSSASVTAWPELLLVSLYELAFAQHM